VKSSDRTILGVIGVLALLAAFWFMILSPKRAEVTKLDGQVASLEASVAEGEQLAAQAELTKTGYKRDYKRLVVLGKAVPGDSDAAGLIEQTETLAGRTGIDFRSIALSTTGASTSATPTAPVAPAPAAAGEAATDTVTTAATAPAPATEAAASMLPIGATVGPAGLPVMPYNMSFGGDFFQVADFLAALDGLVRTSSGRVGVDGRLLTVDGFTLTGDLDRGYPYLDVEMSVTSYVAPADQGATGGATAATPTATIPASTAPPVPTATATPVMP